MSWLALLPLRGGSKSIPGKNLKPIAGRPLYAWSLGAALESGVFERIVVASDDAAIRADVSARFGAAVEVVDRSPATASDTASSESVMLEVAMRRTSEVFCLIQATSPLTRAEDFRAARAQFERELLDSLLTGVLVRRFFWQPDGTPLNYLPAQRPRRQEFAGSVMENGAFYFTRTALLLASGVRLGGHIGVHVMGEEHAAELDEAADWPVIEALLKTRLLDGRRIRLLVVDVDGTLTDGGMYYDGRGEALKKFDTRDAKGMLMLREAGVEVAIVTAETSAVVTARMRKLGLTDYHPGTRDKPAWLRAACASRGLALHEVAYIGDDLNDLEGLALAGLSCCPADAVPEVRRAVTYVCAQRGGAGAVREVCDLIRNQR